MPIVFMEPFSYIFVPLLLLTVLVGGGAAQNKPCMRPLLDIFKSAVTATDGEKVVFNASVPLENIDQSSLKYKWRVFAKGKFTDLEGMAATTLDTTGLGGETVIVNVEVSPVEECTQIDSLSLEIRRKGPYTKADDFWWWVQLNQTNLSGYNDPQYEFLLDQLRERLKEVDHRLTVKIEIQRKDPMKQGLIIGYRAKPYDIDLVNDLIFRAPNLAGFDILIEKP